eukprot:590090_1
MVFVYRGALVQILSCLVALFKFGKFHKISDSKNSETWYSHQVEVESGNRIQKCNEISPKSNEKSSKDTKQGDESRQRSSAAEVKTILGAKYSLQTSLLPSEEAHISHIIDSKNEASGYNPENHLSKELSRIERNLCRIKSSEPTASLFRSVKDSSRLHDVPVKIYSTNISMEQLREEEYKWKATFDDVFASETIERSTKLQKSIREALSENQPENDRNSEK